MEMPHAYLLGLVKHNVKRAHPKSMGINAISHVRPARVWLPSPFAHRFYPRRPVSFFLSPHIGSQNPAGTPRRMIEAPAQVKDEGHAASIVFLIPNVEVRPTAAADLAEH